MSKPPAELHVGKTLFVGSILVAFFVYTYFIRDVPGPRFPVLRGQTMGTTYEVKIVDSPLSQQELRTLQQDIDAALAEVNRLMSTWSEDSEISRFNATSTTNPVPVSAPFANVTAFALDVSRASQGALDPTVGALVDMWGFGPDTPGRAPPVGVDIEAVRQQGSAQDVEVISSTAIRKHKPSLQLDLNAVAKGFAADEISDLLRERGLDDTYVEIGGEIVVRGWNQKGEPWRLGIDLPHADSAPGSALMGVVSLSDRAVATSGDYRNFRIGEDGIRRSHIIDPRNGRPLTNNVASVTVVAPTCMEADAVATALMVMGPENGLPWAESRDHVEAYFLMRDSDNRFSSSMTDGFPIVTE